MKPYQKITKDIIQKLVDILGEKGVSTDPDRLVQYERDEGVEREFFRTPDAVVYPTTAEDVAAVLQLANTENIPVIPRGAGTGLEFGAVANTYGGIILSTEKMNRILEVNGEKMYMVVEPGVRTADVQAAAKAQGLLYAGDPCSGDSCFIGGNASTNAGGNRAVRYGTTRDQIYSIEVVTPLGQITRLGSRLKKVSTGYPLEKIVIGSEGTLGIITKLVLKLVPLPKYSVNVLAIFKTIDDAMSIVNALTKAGIEPTCLEFMDNDSVRVTEKFLGEKQPHSDIGNYMIIQVDSNDEDRIDDLCVALDELCHDHGAIDVFVADAERIWKVRKNFSEASTTDSPIMVMEDFVVPADELADLLKELEKISADQKTPVRSVAHAGDGNLHLDILKKDIPDDQWPAKVEAFEKAAYDAVYRLGGRISGEHGIGEKRKNLMAHYTDPVELALMKAVKKAFDPNDILNPGKIFDVE